ncbi:MAG: hypothetical protein V4580_17340 [Bacteroidota bacterium]
MKTLLTVTIYMLLLTSCFDNTVNETTILAKVDAFTTPAENEELGRDIISYNYSEKLKKQFPDLDLRNVTLQYFRQSSNDEVTIRLIITNTALVYSKELTNFMTPLIKQNMSDYLAHTEGMRNAMKYSDKYSKLIHDKKIDSVWSMTGLNLKEIISKEDLNKAFEQIDSSVDFSKRTLTSKQYYSSLPIGQRQHTGNFYLFNYTYGKAFEQIALQGDSLKLVGYTFYKTTK